MSLVDSVAPALGYPIALSDDADNLSDDSTRFAAWGLLFGQTLTFYDKLFADFLETRDISDDLATWLDAVSKVLLSSETITATDSINNLADALLKRLPQALSVSDAHLDLFDSLASILAYRLEAESNLLEFKYEFQRSKWIKTSVTISEDTSETTSPIGDNNADKFEPQAANSLIYQIQKPVAVDTDYTFTVYLKSATGGNISTELRMWTIGFGDLAQQAITITTSWKKFELTGDSGSNTQIIVSLGGGSTLSTGEDGYIWGAQLIETSLKDQLVFSDSIIKNLITQVTQTAADTMTLTDVVTKTLTQRGVLSLKSEFDNYIRKFLNDPGGLPPKRGDED